MTDKDARIAELEKEKEIESLNRHLSQCQRFICEDGAKIERLTDQIEALQAREREARVLLQSVRQAVAMLESGGPLPSISYLEMIARTEAWLNETEGSRGQFNPD